MVGSAARPVKQVRTGRPDRVRATIAGKNVDRAVRTPHIGLEDTCLEALPVPGTRS
jgi:hypothetical protein